MILRFLLERVFTEDRPYPEKEVNQRLALVNWEAGMYWRHSTTRAAPDSEPGV